jgi:O-antigen ligase
LGNDLNYLGTTLALAMVIAVGLFLGRELLALRSRIFVAAVSLVLPVGLMLTASRTAILSLIAGIALYLAPVGSLKSLLSRFGMALCCLVILVVMVLQNQQTASRLLSAYTEHNLSGRSSIVADSIEMFAEKPLWGWGPVEWWEELGTDTHNLFLYLLLEVGILGMIPYLAALFLCLRSLWRSRQSEWGKLCFAAFSTIMIANLGVNYRNFKPMWLLIAAALSLTIQSSRSRLAGLSLRSSTMPRSSDGGI